MKLTIDGQEVEAREGQTVLQAAEDAGIFIPHLCAHPDLEAVGGCRQCMVCVDGEAEPVCACETLVREGMAVEVHAPEADRVRKMAMQLILATHPADCSGCPKFGVCELQSMYQFMGVSPQGWRLKSRPVPTDESNPLITHMFTRCIRCGRCVRACREMRGVKVLDYQRTEEGIRIGTDGHVSLVDAGCRFCGACIEVCPTGSIIDVLKYNDPDKSREDNVVPCRAACPAHINVPEYLRAIRLGDYDNAASIIHERVPFPEALGRVCTHACETDCKHGEINQPCHLRVRRLEEERPPRPADRQEGRRRGLRPRGPHCRLLPGGQGPRRDCLRGQREGWRPAALWHPRLPHAGRGARPRD